MSRRYRVFYSLPDGVGSGRYSIDLQMADADDWQDAMAAARTRPPNRLFPDADNPAIANNWFDRVEFEAAFEFSGQSYLGLQFSQLGRTEIVIPPDADMPSETIQEFTMMDQKVRRIVRYDSKRDKHWNSRDKVRAGLPPNSLVGNLVQGLIGK